MELLDFKNNSNFIKKVQILSCGNGCENCEKLNGKMYTIDEALNQMPIPNENCGNLFYTYSNYPFCRCLWLTK